MLRLLIDENVNRYILRGLKLRLPDLDFVFVREIGLAGKADVELLHWAALTNRVIVTHDVSTMTSDAIHLVESGRPMAGVILVPEQLSIGIAVKNLEVLLQMMSEANVRDQVTYLPRGLQELQKRR